jgi:hypothetical protein
MVVEAVVLLQVAPAAMRRTAALSLFGILHMALAAVGAALQPLEPLVMALTTVEVEEAAVAPVELVRASSSFHGMHRSLV